MFEEAESPWSIASLEGRWAGFGPYYAMFPISFARHVIQTYSKRGDVVIDPFCGRGTSNYVAQVLGRRSFGCEINPVGWIYAKTKTSPARQVGRLKERVDEILELQVAADFCPENEFQEWAWSEDVLAFIRSARRHLDWRRSKVDRTLAAFLLVYLHAKIGGGLSNQMRQSKSLSPEYSVRWWEERGMRPPQVDPREFLHSRIDWRYSKGFQAPNQTASIYLGDARKGLRRYPLKPASLILTSPPYLGVTNYQYDNWIRLWALGGPPLPDWRQTHRHADRERYADLLCNVFARMKECSRRNVRVVVRTDGRDFTFQTTAHSIDKTWPEHRLYGRRTLAAKPTQTVLFGDKGEKPGEIDLIALPDDDPPPKGFLDITKYR